MSLIRFQNPRQAEELETSLETRSVPRLLAISLDSNPQRRAIMGYCYVAYSTKAQQHLSIELRAIVKANRTQNRTHIYSRTY